MALDTRGRGRPRRADPADLGRRALPVLVAHGYRDTSMARVAEAVGVSVRTLHRYFPTKADIVWGPIDTTFHDLRARLERADPRHGMLDALADALVAGFAEAFESGAEDVATSRARLVLIASTPELNARTSEPFERWRREIARFVAHRTGGDADDLVPASVAAGVQSATMAAISWWAAHDRAATPQDAIARALRALADGQA